MNFLELTSYIDDAQGYAEFPDFLSDVWPLLKGKRNEIEDVFLFQNDSSSSLGWPGYYEVVTQNIRHIRSMDELTDQELSKLEHLSFYGGHLNVLYRVSTESSLPREFCTLYPIVNLSSDDIDQLGLEQKYLIELREFTAALPKQSLYFSFAHDADPLYIFGDLEALRTLLRDQNVDGPRWKL